MYKNIKVLRGDSNSQMKPFSWHFWKNPGHLLAGKQKGQNRGGEEAAMDAAKQLEKDGDGKADTIKNKNKGTVKVG